MYISKTSKLILLVVIVGLALVGINSQYKFVQIEDFVSTNFTTLQSNFSNFSGNAFECPTDLHFENNNTKSKTIEHFTDDPPISKIRFADEKYSLHNFRIQNCRMGKNNNENEDWYYCENVEIKKYVEDNKGNILVSDILSNKINIEISETPARQDFHSLYSIGHVYCSQG